MFIESIAIESFGSYKNYGCTFEKGINIIEGPNEAGKTTLGAFIKFIFYGLNRKGTQNTSLAEIRRYRSWDNDLAAGSLVFQYDGKRYRIERRLKPGARTSGGESVKIIDLATNSECFKGEHPGKLFFGVDEDAFAQSAYVGQTDGGKVNGKTVSAAIENMLFSGDETVSTTAAQKKLDDARILLKHKVRRGGKIDELEDNIGDLTRRLERARSDNKFIFGRESEKKELLERLEKEKEELSLIEKRLSRYAENKKLEKFKYYDTLDSAAREKEKEYDETLVSLTHDDFVPNAEYIARLDTLKNQIGYLDTQIKQNHDDREALGNEKMTADDRSLLGKIREDGGIEKLKKSVEKFSSRHRNLIFFGIMVVLVAVSLIAAALYCFFGVQDPTAAPIAFLGISWLLYGVCLCIIAFPVICFSIFMFVLAGTNRRKRTLIFERYSSYDIGEIEELYAASLQRENQQNVYDERLASIEARGEKLSEEREKLIGEANELISGWGKEYSQIEDISKTSESAKEAIALLDRLLSEKEKAASARDAFVKTLEEYNREEIVRYLEESSEYGDIEEGTEIALRSDFDRRVLENRELEGDIHTLELEIARLSATAENPTELSDEIERLSGQKQGYEICHDAYLLAIDSISSAANKLRDDISPRLTMQASLMMRKETKGKYQQLGVGEDMLLTYGVDTSGVGNVVTREIDYLSEGTKDLAYISLRMALVGLLFTKAKPPIVFDESFARLDDTRLENTLSALYDVSENGCQIFIFTSQTRDSKIMEKIGSAKHIVL